MNLKTAVADAPVNIPIKFSKQFNNTSGAAIDATLHVIVDDNATVNLNGVKVGDASGGWGDNNYPKLPVTLKTGNNIFDIVATNGGGPAALLVALVKKSDNSIIFRSDATWVTNAG